MIKVARGIIVERAGFHYLETKILDNDEVSRTGPGYWVEDTG